MRKTLFARTGFLPLAALLLAPGVARAQNPADPKFVYEKPPAKPADWKVQAKGGLLVTSGSSQGRNGILGLTGSRQQGDNKLSLDASVAYGRSDLLVPRLGTETDAMGNPVPVVYGYRREGQTTTNEWRGAGRYDRFLTANNAAYVQGGVGANEIAGKTLYGGGQLGYSRQLMKTAVHTVAAEAGYDFSFERYVQPPGKALEPVTIHSARLFVGDLWTVAPGTGVGVSLEALFNLNEEKALYVGDQTGKTAKVGAFKDTRLVAKTNVTTNLRESLSLGFGFTLRYDQNPAPRPIPGSAGGARYATDFISFAPKLDTLTEITLIYSFL